MSTAVAYPPSHSSSRHSSNPDPQPHHSNTTPRTFSNLVPISHSTATAQQSAMASSSSSPPHPSSVLAPRPSVEEISSNLQSNPASSNSQSSPSQLSKLPQPNQSDNGDHDSSQIVVPSVEVKKERPSTPDPPLPAPSAPPAARHRPRKLDLTTNISVPPGRPSAPMTGKDSTPLTAMQDIGLACLSPGFQTEDPRMSQQLQRSMDLREQQRQIIEARLQKGGKDSEASGSKAPSDSTGPQTNTFSKPPGTSRRKGPPPGLTITAPSAHQFAGEPRVIQSAPLHQSFTGLHNKPGSSHVHPLSRQVLEVSHQHHRTSNQNSSATAASSSQQYAPHVSTPQTATRLPPIQDVFANENLGSSPYRPSHTLSRANSGPGGSTNAQVYAPLTAAGNSSNHSPKSTQYARALPSPAYPPPPQSAGLQPPPRRQSARDRDFKSAEEAVHAMAGGREDLLPKIVHYGGHQPPTPPSPLPPGAHNHSGERHYHHPSSLKMEAGGDAARSMSGRRRNREEYERDYNERESAQGDKMDVDGERERGRNAAPSIGNGEAGPGFGFGFGSWSADEARRRSPETMRRKKEEFMTLCSRAWDLMHE